MRIGLVPLATLLLAACSSPQIVPATTFNATNSVTHTEIGGGPIRAVTISCNGEARTMRLRLQVPRWPESAPEELSSGNVMVRFTINQQGEPEQLQLVSANDEHFVDAALSLVRQARFEFAADLAPCVVGLPMQLPVRFERD